MFSFHKKKTEQPTFDIEPLGKGGYYRYKRKFTQVEYGLALSPFLRSGFVWFYILFSLYGLVLFNQFFHVYWKDSHKSVILPFQHTLTNATSYINNSEILLMIFFLISCIFSYLLFNNYTKLARFIMLTNLSAMIILFIGVFKTLALFT